MHWNEKSYCKLLALSYNSIRIKNKCQLLQKIQIHWKWSTLKVNKIWISEQHFRGEENLSQTQCTLGSEQWAPIWLHPSFSAPHANLFCFFFFSPRILLSYLLHFPRENNWIFCVLKEGFRFPLSWGYTDILSVFFLYPSEIYYERRKIHWLAESCENGTSTTATPPNTEINYIHN